MNSVMKRFISVLLVLVMCISLVPFSAFADDVIDIEEVTVEEPAPEEEENPEEQPEEPLPTEQPQPTEQPEEPQPTEQPEEETEQPAEEELDSSLADDYDWSGTITVMENQNNIEKPGDEDFVLSEKATVEIGSFSGTVSSKGTIQVSLNMSDEVIIKSDGYVTRKLSAVKIIGDPTVYLQKESEDYPVVSALWLSSGDGRLTDVLHNDYVIYAEGEAFHLTPEIQWPGGEVSLSLTQDNGTAVDLDLGSTYISSEDVDKFDFTKDIVLYIDCINNGSSKEVRKKVNIYADEYYKTIPEWISGYSFSFTDSLSPITMPKCMGPLAGSSFSTDLFSPVPVEIQVEGNKWYAAIGYKKATEYEDGEWTPKKFTESVKDLKGKWNKLTDAAKKLADLNKTRKDMGKILSSQPGKFGASGSFSVMAYAEGTFNKNKEVIVTSSGGFILFEGSLEYTKQCMAWVIPWYWEVTFSGSLQAQLNFIFAHPFAAKSFTADVDIKAGISLDVGIGIGVAKLLTAGGGFKGSLDADWKLNLSKTKYFQLKATINGYLKLRALWFTYDYPFDPIFEKVLYEYFGDEHPPASASLEAPEAASPGDENEDMETGEEWFFDPVPVASLDEAPGEESEEPSAFLEGVYDTSNYTPDDLSYLNSGSMFVPAELTASLASGRAKNITPSVLVSNAYSEADPQVAAFSDGRMIAVWIGYNKQSSGADALQLYYSYFDGSWSEPALIEADETADAYPELEVINDTAYVVWTDFSASVAADQDLDSIAGKTEISAAVFDSNTASFTVSKLTSSSGAANLNPVICGDSTSVYAVWLRNGSSDWFGQNGGNQVLCSSFDGSSWSTPSVLASGLNPVIDFDADCSGGSCSALYSMDTDGDLRTADDIEVFCNGSKLTDNNIPDSGVCCGNGTRFWVSGNDIVENGSKINSDDFVFTYDRFEVVNNSIIVFTKPDGVCSTLYAMFRGGSGWGEPVALTDGSSCVRYFSAITDASGNLCVLMEIQSVSGDGSAGDPFGASEIVWINAPSLCDITLNSVVYEHTDYDSDNTVTLELNITNNSTLEVNGLNISVRLPGTDTPVEFTNDTVIGSGKTVNVQIDLPVTEVYQDQMIDVTALPANLTDAYPDDNTCTAVLNRNNLAVRNMQFGITYLGEHVVTANIFNEGYSDVENVTVSLIYGSEGAVPMQTVNIGTVGRLSGKGVSFELSDPRSGAYYITVSADIEEDYYGDNSSLATLDRKLLDSISIEEQYLALNAGDSRKLTCVCEPAELSDKLVWSVENADEGDTNVIISVQQDGTVTAVSAGTAYAVASVEVEAVKYSVRCRIDVVGSSETPISQAVTAVSLMNSKATVELYSTNYTAVGVLLERDALLTASLSDETVPADNGSAIESAFFINSEGQPDDALNNLFRLRVKDDRTLEIIPDAANAVEASLANPKALAGTYKSNIRVIVDGHDYDTGLLTITVKKSMPKVKAAALKFNPLKEGQTLELVFAGGKVSRVKLDTAKAGAKNDASTWLTVNESGTVQLKEGVRGKHSGKLYLKLEVEGWAVEQSLTVSVSAAEKAPKLSFSKSSVRLFQNADGHADVYVKSITPAEFKNSPVIFSAITEGKASYPNGDVLKCSATPDAYGLIRVGWGDSAPKDGRAHTYKVYYQIEGKQFSFTVKVPKYSAPSMSLKTAGKIERNLNGSFVSVTASFKNINVGSELAPEVWFISDKDGRKADSSISSKFILEKSSTYCVIKANPEDLPDAGTYYITAGAQAATCELIKTVKFTVKATDSAKLQPSVTLRAAGKIDVIRPDTAIALIPVVKNCYIYELSPDDLTFYRDGVEESEAPFTVEVMRGQYIIMANGCSSASKYTVKAKLSLYGTETESKPVKLTVKMGSAKGTVNRKTVTLFKKDRYSSDSVIITLKDSSLTKIADVRLDDKTKDLFDIRELNSGEYEIRWKGNQVTADKTVTVKLGVFLEGNMTAKPNFTVSVKVIVK